jgi:hypothetical protein
MTNAPRTQAVKQTLPATVIERTRNWAWEEFNFGEWFPTADIAKFMRTELGYSGTTPGQYAAKFVARGVEHNDFETRLNGREWRWICHPRTSDTAN